MKVYGLDQNTWERHLKYKGYYYVAEAVNIGEWDSQERPDDGSRKDVYPCSGTRKYKSTPSKCGA